MSLLKTFIKFLSIFLVIGILSCESKKKATSQKRGFMILKSTEQPFNYKFHEKRFKR